MCLEGSDGFVTSTAAPIATGRSNPVAGWDLHPLKTNTFARRTLAASPFRPLLRPSRPDNRSLHPVAIGAAAEVTKPSKPSRQRVASGGSASRQAATEVNAVNAWGQTELCAVNREVLVFSGCNSHLATGSLQPVAIGAAVEVTKPSEPSRPTRRCGDAASRQAVT